MKRRAAAASVALGCVVAASVAIAATQHKDEAAVPARHGSLEERLLQERQWLDRVGSSRVGEGYACSVVTPRKPPRADPRLIILVSSRNAAVRARALGGQLTSPGRVEVRLTSPRFRMSRMRAIESYLRRELPPGARNLSFGRAGFMETPSTRCPPVVILLQHRRHNATSVERWAAHAVARFGRDRVKVKRVSGDFTTADTR